VSLGPFTLKWQIPSNSIQSDGFRGKVLIEGTMKGDHFCVILWKTSCCFPIVPAFSHWSWSWVNYSNSPKIRSFGVIPYTNHHSSEGNQWGRYLFDPYADKICRPRLRSSPFEILLNCALWGELWAQSSARELWWFDGSNHQIAVNPGFKLITPHGLIAEPCFIWQSKSVSHCFTFHILVLGDPPGFRPASGVNFPATGKTTHTMSAAESMAHG
jgi:hypothetical protein